MGNQLSKLQNYKIYFILFFILGYRIEQSSKSATVVVFEHNLRP